MDVKHLASRRYPHLLALASNIQYIPSACHILTIWPTKSSSLGHLTGNQSLRNPPSPNSLNQVKPKTDVEARVYEVLSHKNWGAASSIMNQIARDTWDYEKFAIITRIMWENVETQRPSAWRVIFKGLSLLEHLVKNGSERCVDDARNHGHVLRKLHQFNYYEGTIDRGMGVREKSKQLVEILGDNDRVREERQKAKTLREKFQGKSAAASGGGGGGGYSGGDGWSNSGGGKDEWNSGGGYASGGIDSAKDNFSSGARGRYNEEHGSSAAAAPAPGPTFAQLPPAKQTASKAGKKVKKKKAPVSTPDSGAPTPGPGKFITNASLSCVLSFEAVLRISQSSPVVVFLPNLIFRG
jgi:uncharacterized membrane protein YgcG